MFNFYKVRLNIKFNVIGNKNILNNIVEDLVDFE